MQPLVDLGIFAAALTAILTTVVLVARLRPVRWVWRRLVTEPLAHWFRVQVAHEVEPRIAELRYEVVKVVGEFKTNGGDSLRDRVDAVDAKADAIAAEQAAVREELAKGR